MTVDPADTDPRGPDLADAELLSMLSRWLPQQRWFAGDVADDLSIESRAFVGDVDWAAVEHLVITAPAPGGTVGRYQLWLGWRDQLPDRLTHSAIGAIGGCSCYD